MFRRLLALLLALCALCTISFAEESTASWIEISDASDLFAIADNPSGHYRLVNDIDCSDISWTPIPFSGELDGNGYAILNLTIKEVGSEHFTSIDANKKKYDTVGAALFSVVSNASIHDLSLLGVGISISTEENCFCAGIAAAGGGIVIKNCTVEGRVWLRQGGRNSGVGGIVGYAQANVADCTVDVELVFVDRNVNQTCEEFAGGILACGVANIINCKVNSTLYASIHGYCHSGGLIGLYWRGSLGQQKCKIDGCSVSFTSNFFEDVSSRRAYNDIYIGEEYSYGMSFGKNEKVSFAVNETKDFSKELYPCTCGKDFTSEIIAPTLETYGYTQFTCPVCGYSLRRMYTARQAV